MGLLELHYEDDTFRPVFAEKPYVFWDKEHNRLQTRDTKIAHIKLQEDE